MRDIHDPNQTHASPRRNLSHLFRNVPKAWTGYLWCSGARSLVQRALRQMLLASLENLPTHQLPGFS